MKKDEIKKEQERQQRQTDAVIASQIKIANLINSHFGGKK